MIHSSTASDWTNPTRNPPDLKKRTASISKPQDAGIKNDKPILDDAK
jgi:hypothetical protein